MIRFSQRLVSRLNGAVSRSERRDGREDRLLQRADGARLSTVHTADDPSMMPPTTGEKAEERPSEHKKATEEVAFQPLRPREAIPWLPHVMMPVKLVHVILLASPSPVRV